jgi:putative methionine-R-sulfoxide reductase with GAF domain
MPQLDTREPARHPREREARQLALIHRIARIVAENLTVRARLQQIVRLLQEHLHCEFVACASIDLRRGRFRCEALATDIPSMIHVGYGRDLGNGVVGEVAASGQTLYVPDVVYHANYIETMPGAHSELCVAMRHNGEVMGVINAEATRCDAFAEEIDLLETIAEQLAGMFAAERLYSEQRQRVELLGMLSELSRTASTPTGWTNCCCVSWSSCGNVSRWNRSAYCWPIRVPTACASERMPVIPYSMAAAAATGRRRSASSAARSAPARRNTWPTSSTIRTTCSAIPRSRPNTCCRSACAANSSACSIWRQPIPRH